MEYNANIVEQVLDPELILQFPPEQIQQSFFWESRFPSRTIQGSKYEFELDQDTRVTMARFHALNSNTDLDQRTGRETAYGTLGYLKRERSLNEDDLLMLAAPVSDIAFRQARDNAYNDSWAMIQACRERVEAVRAEVVTTGKLVIDENGYKAEYDFGIPEENKNKELQWNDPKTDILQDVLEICDDVENNGQGIRPAYMIVANKTIQKLLANEKLRSAMFGVNSAIYPTQATLNAAFQSWGLPQIVRYNDTARFANANNTGFVEKRLMDEDQVIFIPEGPLGETIYGTTPEEVNARIGGDVLSRSNNIVLQIMAGHDYETQTIKASTRFFVALTRPKQIVLAKITE